MRSSARVALADKLHDDAPLPCISTGIFVCYCFALMLLVARTCVAALSLDPFGWLVRRNRVVSLRVTILLRRR